MIKTMYPFWSAILSAVLAQLLKPIVHYMKTGKWNLWLIKDSGGMPSSHSSTVCALTTASAIHYGPGSFEFAISFVLSMIVMYDAMNVRMETGKQSELLNRVFFENILELDAVVLQEKLKEYVGHTPIQVIAGCILGLLIGWILH